jgi:hypothetical protein
MIKTNCNVGKVEKNIRALIGILIFIAGIYFTSWWGMVAIYPLLTSVFKWCPINHALHVDHCHEKESGNPLEGNES